MYLAATQAIVAQLIANWTTTRIIYDNQNYEPQGTVNISASNDISAASGDNSFSSAGGNFTGISAGSFIKVSGFSNSGNNGYCKVTSATSSKLVVTGLTLTTEAAGASTITIDDLNIPWLYLAVDFLDSEARSLGTPDIYPTLYRALGNIEVNIFTPINEGPGLGLSYADTISSIFRGKELQDVVCFSPVVLSGREVKFSTGNWWATPVICSFEVNKSF